MVLETDKQSSFDSRACPRVTPSNPFIKFSRNDIEQSISSRFQQIVQRDPSRIAIKMEDRVVTYGTLNKMANRVARDPGRVLWEGEAVIPLLPLHSARRLPRFPNPGGVVEEFDVLIIRVARE